MYVCPWFARSSIESVLELNQAIVEERKENAWSQTRFMPCRCFEIEIKIIERVRLAVRLCLSPHRTHRSERSMIDRAACHPYGQASCSGAVVANLIRNTVIQTPIRRNLRWSFPCHIKDRWHRVKPWCWLILESYMLMLRGPSWMQGCKIWRLRITYRNLLEKTYL